MDEDAQSMISQGPSVVVEGTVFLRKKTCSCCGIHNTCPNEILGSSTLSAEKQKFTLWIRGTPTDPVGKHCRVCSLTYVHGGFTEEPNCPNIDMFSEKMRKTPELNAAFRGARLEMLRILGEGKIRFRSTSARDSKARLEKARDNSLEEFRSSEQVISTDFRAILRTKFEEQHPGKIEAEGLQVVTKMIEGQKREVVLIRKLPDDEWDLSLKERTGVLEREVLDTSELQITPGQLKSKFEGRRQKLHSQVVEKGNSAAVLEKSSARGSQDVDEDNLDVRSSSSEEDLGVSSLLEQEIIGPAPKKAAAPATAAKAVSKANPAGSKVLPPAPRTSSNSKPPQGSVQPTPMEHGADADSKKRGRPSKFQGKNSEDVLDSQGLTQIKEQVCKAPHGRDTRYSSIAHGSKAHGLSPKSLSLSPKSKSKSESKS